MIRDLSTFAHRVLYTALACILLTSVTIAQKRGAAEKGGDSFDASALSGFKFRSIGTAMTSGRIVDLAVDTRDPSRFFVAVACGGVWRTTNAGSSFTPVFDAQESWSIGCVAIDPSNPHTVWVGTGENNSQRSVGYGDGVYRSDDDGTTWKNMGLKTSEHIGKILVDPRNPLVVYVAAQGPLWAAGGERGLYKTTDGGATWNAVLRISENTGVTDAVFDPRNPDVIIAASYQRRRHVWTLIDGGPEARMFRTTNGGATWDTLRAGLPSGDLGRIGFAVAPSNPDVIYSIIEANDDRGGVFRSTDRGVSWEKRSGYQTVSAQYYQELVVDPRDADRLVVLDTYSKVSEDGGKTWRPLGNRFRHVDDHALWIDPADTRHMLMGCDGGLYESRDAGATWRFFENLPVAQFYRVTTDNALPFYNVYGGTQDNSSVGGPSRTTREDGIFNEDWFFTNGGDGFESQVDPSNPDIVYAQSQYGGLVRWDKKSGERKGIQPQPAPGEEPLRWNWDSPLLVSPHKNTRLYFAAQKIFRSDDRGDSWTPVSGDLTRRIDRNSLPVMDKLWSPDAIAKNASTSFYGNIVAFDESPKAEGLLIAGTDDGLIQISENGGAAWRRIERVEGVPERTYVSFVHASPVDPSVIYASFDNHKMADFKPYVFRSNDRGATWTPIMGNLPARGSVYCIVSDFEDPNLLFAGTEFGLYVTLDGGKKWAKMSGGLPPAAIKDIAIQRRENDLVLATFGRGFYVLDNYAPLRSMSKEVLDKPAYIFPVADALMFIQSDARGRGAFGETFFASENPPFGATVTYNLKESIKTRKERRKDAEKEAEKKKEAIAYPPLDSLRAEDEEEKPMLEFAFADASGSVVRTLTAPAVKGVKRITWDLRYPSAAPVNADADVNKASSMLALPGQYTVTLSSVVDGKRTVLAGPVPFTARVLENTTLPASDRAALVAFQKEIASVQRVVLGASRSVGDVRARVQAVRTALRLASASPELQSAARTIDDALRVMQRDLNGDPSASKRDENQPPSIVGRLQEALYSQWSTTSAPSPMHRAEIEHVRTQIAPLLERLRTLVDTDLRSLEAKMDAAGIPWTPGRIPTMR